MRKTIVVLSITIALLLTGYIGYQSYAVWRQSHGVAMARRYLDQGDLRQAFLSLQEVLRLNPQNLDACRMMAGLMESQHSPMALNLYERILELNPNSLDDRLALAQAAIFRRDNRLASNTLAAASAIEKENSRYQDLAGTAALVAGNQIEAEAHFSEAIRLNPSDAVPRLNLAVVRLHQTNLVDLAQARAALREIDVKSTNADLRVQAERELIADAMRFQDFPTALELSKKLTEQAGSAFTDKLLRLDVLKRTKDNEFKPTLELFRREAATDPAKISDLTKWQTMNFSATEALDWLKRLPNQTQTNVAVEVLTANIELQLNDWRELQTSVQGKDWEDAAHPWSSLEFMRHAFLARALRGQGLSEASTAEWTVAVKSASNQKLAAAQKAAFRTLFDLSVAWKWDTEAEQVLWTVVNEYPDEKWAFPVLRNALIIWHRTRSLMQLLEIMEKRVPQDVTIQNDLASVALLLDAQEIRPYDLARSVHEEAPTNAVCSTTYAFSLYKQGQFADALKVMQRLSPADLEQPGIAFYYCLILRANGKATEAKPYLARVPRGQLFPEEQALYDQAGATSAK